MVRITIPFLFYLLTLSVHATTYYVSSSQGNDNNVGTSPEKAWATLEKVQVMGNKFVSGDVIAFFGGDEFYGTINWSYLGSKNVIFTSYGSGKAIFTGAKIISGWENQGGNIWTASVPEKRIYHVIIDDELKGNGRLPKIDSDLSRQGNYYTIHTSPNTSTIISKNLIGSPDLVGAYCFVKGDMNSLERRTIKHFNPGTGVITLDAPVTTLNAGDLFFVNNHINLVSKENEWFYDTSKNVLMLYSTANPNNIRVITQEDSAFHLEATFNITIENIEFNGFKDHVIYLENGGGYFIKNNVFKNTYKDVIFGSSKITTVEVSKNVFKNLTNTSANISSGSGLNLTFNDNHIENVGLLSQLNYLGYTVTTSQGTGFVMYKGNASGNVLKNLGYKGISFYGGGTLMNNYIENPCLSGADGGAIYTYEHPRYGSAGAISNNILINTASFSGAYDWQVFGIMCDQSSQNVLVTNNSISGFYHNIFMNHGARNKFTKNNLYNAFKASVLLKVLDGYALVNESNVFTQNNLYNENSKYDPIKIYNAKNASIDYVSLDYNKYFNPFQIPSVYVVLPDSGIHETLNSWQKRSGQDMNSMDDNGYIISDSHFAYNPNKVSSSITIPKGTWQDLDGNIFIGSVFLEPFTSKLLISSEKLTGQIKPDAGKDQTICSGTSATLTASGGTSYKWSTGATTKSIEVSPTETTTYSVEVSDGTTTDTDEVVVRVQALPIAGAGGNQTILAGESATLTATGGDTYLWNTGETKASITVSPTTTTNYEVTVTKNGCSATDVVKVTVNSATAPPVTVTADAGKDQTICSGNSATLTASEGSAYKWSTGETTRSITVSPDRTTTYILEATRGGVTDTDEVIVTVINCDVNNEVNTSTSNTTGTTDTSPFESDTDNLNKAELELTVYPNPTEGKINLLSTVPLTNFNLVLMNMNGNVIHSETMDRIEEGIEKELDLSRFAKGVYLLQLYDSEDSYIKKVIVI